MPDEQPPPSEHPREEGNQPHEPSRSCLIPALLLTISSLVAAIIYRSCTKEYEVPLPASSTARLSSRTIGISPPRLIYDPVTKKYKATVTINFALVGVDKGIDLLLADQETPYEILLVEYHKLEKEYEQTASRDDQDRKLKHKLDQAYKILQAKRALWLHEVLKAHIDAGLLLHPHQVKAFFDCINFSQRRAGREFSDTDFSDETKQKPFVEALQTPDPQSHAYANHPRPSERGDPLDFLDGFSRNNVQGDTQRLRDFQLDIYERSISFFLKKMHDSEMTPQEVRDSLKGIEMSAKASFLGKPLERILRIIADAERAVSIFKSD